MKESIEVNGGWVRVDMTGPNKGFIKLVVQKDPKDRRKTVEAWSGICM